MIRSLPSEGRLRFTRADDGAGDGDVGRRRRHEVRIQPHEGHAGSGGGSGRRDVNPKSIAALGDVRGVYARVACWNRSADISIAPLFLHGVLTPERRDPRDLNNCRHPATNREVFPGASTTSDAFTVSTSDGMRSGSTSSRTGLAVAHRLVERLLSLHPPHHFCWFRRGAFLRGAGRSPPAAMATNGGRTMARISFTAVGEVPPPIKARAARAMIARRRTAAGRMSLTCRYGGPYARDGKVSCLFSRYATRESVTFRSNSCGKFK